MIEKPIKYVPWLCSDEGRPYHATYKPVMPRSILKRMRRAGREMEFDDPQPPIFVVIRGELVPLREALYNERVRSRTPRPRPRRINGRLARMRRPTKNDLRRRASEAARDWTPPWPLPMEPEE